MRAFQQVLAGRRIELSEADYYHKYLGMDDYDCFRTILIEHGLEVSEEEIARLTAAKSSRVKVAYRQGVRAQSGAVELLRQAELDAMPMAICSGALHEEVMMAAQAVGVA